MSSDELAGHWGDVSFCYVISNCRIDIAEAKTKGYGGFALLRISRAARTASTAATSDATELAAEHLVDHAKYLRGWVKAIEKDPIAISPAAKNAENISEYVLGLEK